MYLYTCLTVWRGANTSYYIPSNVRERESALAVEREYRESRRSALCALVFTGSPYVLRVGARAHTCVYVRYAEQAERVHQPRGIIDGACGERGRDRTSIFRNFAYLQQRMAVYVYNMHPECRNSRSGRLL